METGHPLKSLIGTDRLKAYTVDDREALSRTDYRALKFRE